MLVKVNSSGYLIVEWVNGERNTESASRCFICFHLWLKGRLRLLLLTWFLGKGNIPLSRRSFTRFTKGFCVKGDVSTDWAPIPPSRVSNKSNILTEPPFLSQISTRKAIFQHCRHHSFTRGSSEKILFDVLPLLRQGQILPQPLLLHQGVP